jgi:hypothetical protein
MTPPTPVPTAAPTPEPAPTTLPWHAVRVVGVFVAGTESLIIGARYLLSLEGETFEVLGPLETSPSQARITRDLAEVDVSVIRGQILVTSSVGRPLAVAFNVMPGENPDALEAAVRQAASRSSAS